MKDQPHDTTIPGPDRSFTREETDDLYRDLRSYFNTANLISEGDGEPVTPEMVAVASDKVRVEVAVGSGAADNVIGLDDLPAGVSPRGQSELRSATRAVATSISTARLSL